MIILLPMLPARKHYASGHILTYHDSCTFMKGIFILSLDYIVVLFKLILEPILDTKCRH